MLHFEGAKMVQERSPLFVLFKILVDMLGKKNVPGVPAGHNALRDIDSGSGKIRTIIHVDHAAHWSAVDSHPKLQARMFPESAADLHCALRRSFRTGVKNQSHPVAGRDFKQTAGGFGSLKLLRGANNLV